MIRQSKDDTAELFSMALLTENKRLQAINAELLAALEKLVRMSDGHPGSFRERQEARAAIAKATPGAQ